MSYAYPILLDLREVLVVVVGGGAVAARKARTALAAGALVRLVALRLGDALPGGVERVCEEYTSRHLAGAQLAFAATDDPAVNAAVVRDAKAAGIWVNRADAEDAGEGEAEGTGGAGGAGNFIVPAQFNNGGVIVSVSAGSAAVSVAIRDQLKERFDPTWGRMAAIIRNMRPLVRTSQLAPSRRAAILREMAAFLEAGDEHVKEEEAVRDWLRRRLAQET